VRGRFRSKGVESHVADLLVECLEKEGVHYVFGVPGEEIEDLLFAVAASSIAFVPCRHEQGAVFIADVWGRLTGKAGVCLATLGPRVTNLLTGVADANFDKAPLVGITGQGGLDRLHHESHQRSDVVRMFESVTKWNSVNLELVEKLERYWQGASRALPRTREMS
jgi:acetolactate synthase-1/2/3 large subunit